MLQTISLIALLLFSVLMVLIGVYSAKHTKTMEGFLLGGRKIGPWMSAFAYGTSYFSAVIFIGYAGKIGWDGGFAVLDRVGNAFFGSLLPGCLWPSAPENDPSLNVRTCPNSLRSATATRK
jgi:SSS family solute:Na+ symporter